MRRRDFLSSLSALPSSSGPRTYHVCLNPDVLDQNPDLLPTVRKAGVHTIWLCGFLYGHWYYTPQRVIDWAARIRRAGLNAEIVFVPLGHPGDSLGAQAGEPPLIPPPHWSKALRPDGSTHWGTSLHPPATEENLDAIRALDAGRFRTIFLDDDYRLANGPGQIGGCHCDDHWAAFQKAAGPQNREALKADIQSRTLSRLLRSWVDFHCDELTRCHRRLAAVRPQTAIGIMVMYLGSEKAGIRLGDYRNVPFRVGELMFADRHFNPVKGKTDELFSSLFHRRFTPPDLAYSESTAFPANQLSAANMAAKLCVSTLSDVRHTMFMSGLTPFPIAHWDTLAPAMRHHAKLHSRLRGLKPTGPFKHYWGEPSRYVGADKPYSLFLAAGVPFEVASSEPQDGWTFLSDEDAALNFKSTRPITRKDVPETLPDLFALRRRILPEFANTPYIEEEHPAVCAWYREANLAAVWNLTPEPKTLTLRQGPRRRTIQAAPLALELIDL